MGLELINQIRKEQKLTAKILSEKTNIPLGTLNKILNGITKNPAYETVYIIAKALNYPVDAFVDNELPDQPTTFIRRTPDEEQLLSSFNKLNDLGKKEANKRVSELTEISLYVTAKEEYNLAAHDDGLDSEKARERLNKAKEIFKQMDENKK